jgi:hypothetical protein
VPADEYQGAWRELEVVVLLEAEVCTHLPENKGQIHLF